MAKNLSMQYNIRPESMPPEAPIVLYRVDLNRTFDPHHIAD